HVRVVPRFTSSRPTRQSWRNIRRDSEATPPTSSRPEARTRIKRLLSMLGPGHETPPSAEVICFRIIEALELNGTPEAPRGADGTGERACRVPGSPGGEGVLKRLAASPATKN